MVESKLKKDRHNQRVMIYYTYLTKLYNEKNYEQVWEMLKNVSESYQKVLQLDNDYIREYDFSIFLEKCEEKVMPENIQETANVFEQVKYLLEKESEGEMACYNYLKDVSRKHPIIARFVVAVLLTILTNVASDIISDACILSKEYKEMTTFNENEEIVEELEQIYELLNSTL